MLPGNHIWPGRASRYGVAVEATWVSRDLPVLDATVTLLEEGMDLPEVVDIARKRLACG